MCILCVLYLICVLYNTACTEHSSECTCTRKKETERERIREVLILIILWYIMCLVWYLVKNRSNTRLVNIVMFLSISKLRFYRQFCRLLPFYFSKFILQYDKIHIWIATIIWLQNSIKTKIIHTKQIYSQTLIITNKLI